MGAVPAAFGRWTRRAFLVSGLARWAFAEQKGALLPSAWHRYSDPATEFEVLRLTDPAHSCWLPAYYNRTLARRGGFLLYSSDDTGGPQACRMDLHSGESRRLTEAAHLDAAGRAQLLLLGRPRARSDCVEQPARAPGLRGGRGLGAMPWSKRRGRWHRAGRRKPRWRLPPACHWTAERRDAHHHRSSVHTVAPAGAAQARADPLSAGGRGRMAGQLRWHPEPQIAGGRRTHRPGALVAGRPHRPVPEFPGRPDAVARHPRMFAGPEHRQAGRTHQPVRAFRMQHQYIRLRGRQPEPRRALHLDPAAADAPRTGW